MLLGEIDSVDCHIHLESIREAEKLLHAMDRAGVATAILMGSSRFTITLRSSDGFTQYHENNVELLKVRNAHPDRFEVWPTLDPVAPDNCRRLQDYVSKGASGLKLYVGHGFRCGNPPKYLFHTVPIDHDLLQGLYQYCTETDLPVCLHVNTAGKEVGFREEFERFLNSNPYLKVHVPHWMLASRRPGYLRSVFDRFPNVSTDVSFGQDTFLRAGLRRLSQNAQTISELVEDYSSRVLYGSDIVCTSASHKTVEWMATRMLCYRCMLGSADYECPITHEKRTGLSLSEETLRSVLRSNARCLLSTVEVHAEQV